MASTEIKFKPKINKIIEVILYLAGKGIELSRYKLVKLVYLADYEHLNRYGRPITYDTITAMENGPVPSTLYSILKKDRRYGIDYDALLFDFVARGDRHYIENPERDINQKLFSKTDILILDEIAQKYGDKTFRDLYDLTHEHKGYKRAWKNKGERKSEPIKVEDLIEEREDKADLIEYLNLTCQHIHS